MAPHSGADSYRQIPWQGRHIACSHTWVVARLSKARLGGACFRADFAGECGAFAGNPRAERGVRGAGGPPTGCRGRAPAVCEGEFERERARNGMTTWHHARRITAAVVGGIVAWAAEGRGLSLVESVLMGVAVAIIVGAVVFPLLFQGGDEDE